VAIQTLHSFGETFNIVTQSPEILSKGLKRRATDQRTVIMNQPLEGCGSRTIHQIAATRCGGTHSFAHPMRCQIPNDARQVFLHIPTQLTRKPRNRSGECRIALNPDATHGTCTPVTQEIQGEIRRKFKLQSHPRWRRCPRAQSAILKNRKVSDQAVKDLTARPCCTSLSG
jgi:hypothetical protein